QSSTQRARDISSKSPLTFRPISVDSQHVLMDVVMPGMSGIEATRKIKKMSPATSVVVLTAYEDDRYILGLLEAGAAGYLLKTSTGNDVVQALKAVSAGESVLNPQVAAKVLARAVRTPAMASVSTEQNLTTREMEVLKLAARGLSNKEIAADLSLRTPTVKSHLVNVFTKMGTSSRTEAVLEALRRGWIGLEDGTQEPEDSEIRLVGLSA
ncbi:MAG: response regulator transcription factor, partial [SAR202 cluster bacterium]|nr:response regulator transcription factor [SAR202 cluster bacterium]